MEMTWPQFKHRLEVQFDEMTESELDMATHIFLSDGNLNDAMDAIDKMRDEEFDDSMDGDHDSAMATCGWGTDEDYGCYGEDF